MSMKEAFDTYFEKMNNSWRKEMGTLPRVSAGKRYEDCGLFVSEKDEKGYRQWQPKLQTEPMDFEPIEKELGFKIHPQIKEYVSTYWFMFLEGSTDIVDDMQLDKILPSYNFMQEIKHRFSKEELHYLKDGEYFMIGGFCCINNNDSYLISVNNETGEVTAVQCFDKISIKLANSIEDLLKSMKGVWDK